MSKFEPGDKRINRKGRPKGSANKTTEDLRAIVYEFLQDNLETLQEDFDKLEPKDRLNLLDRLLKHILPTPVADISQFSDTDLQILLKRLNEKQLRIDN
jgi:hypothetical protein